ncbi:hypothetical protein Drorol1_Dr00014550 [Drosera rotundifolia]
MRNIISSKSKLSQRSSPKLLRIAQPSPSPHIAATLSSHRRHTAALRRPQSSHQPPSSPHLCHRHTLLTTPPPHLNPPAIARLLFLAFSSLQFPSLAAFSPLHREEEWL